MSPTKPGSEEHLRAAAERESSPATGSEGELGSPLPAPPGPVNPQGLEDKAVEKDGPIRLIVAGGLLASVAWGAAIAYTTWWLVNRL